MSSLYRKGYPHSGLDEPILHGGRHGTPTMVSSVETERNLENGRGAGDGKAEQQIRSAARALRMGRVAYNERRQQGQRDAGEVLLVIGEGRGSLVFGRIRFVPIFQRRLRERNIRSLTGRKPDQANQQQERDKETASPSQG